MPAPRTDSILSIAEARSIPEPNTGCWLWEGMTNGKGYALIKARRYREAHKEGRIRVETVSRLVCEATHGPMSSDQKARHTCDQPSCVNPAHLIPGSHNDNMQDCIRRGRKNHCFGEKNGQAKVNADQIKEIKAARNIVPARVLAERFGLKQSYIYQIWIGRRWCHF